MKMGGGTLFRNDEKERGGGSLNLSFSERGNAFLHLLTEGRVTQFSGMELEES